VFYICKIRYTLQRHWNRKSANAIDSVLQCAVVCCSVLQCVAGTNYRGTGIESVLQHTATHYRGTGIESVVYIYTIRYILQRQWNRKCPATHCNTLQRHWNRKCSIYIKYGTFTEAME